MTTCARRPSAALPDGKLLVGGEWRPASSEDAFDVIDPSTGGWLTSVADASPVDALDAVRAASAAQSGWAATAPRERAEMLRRAYELLVTRCDALAAVIVAETGKV